MRSLSEIRKTLKNQPFYSIEIESESELPFFPKKSKKLTIKQLSNVLPFLPKRKKDLKD